MEKAACESSLFLVQAYRVNKFPSLPQSGLRTGIPSKAKPRPTKSTVSSRGRSGNCVANLFYAVQTIKSHSSNEFRPSWACHKIAISHKHRLHRKPPLCKGRWPEGPEGLCAGNRCQQRPLSHASRDSIPIPSVASRHLPLTRGVGTLRRGAFGCGQQLCRLLILQQALFL